MKALRVSSGNAKVADVPLPASDREALIRVVRSGICNTDLEIAKGYAGFEGTIGHEFVGVVESAPGSRELVGKRVVGEINAGCGGCVLCLAGDPRHCPDRTVLGIKGRDGSHAEFLLLPEENLLTVPDNVSDDEAVFVEPLAAALGIGEQADILPDSRVAVIGDGKLGLLAAFGVRLSSSNVTLFGKHREKMLIAEARDIETSTADRVAVMQGTFDIVIEASGSESGFASALDLVRPRGKIVLKSTFAGKPVWEAWRVVVDEITVVGSRCGRFGPAIEALADGSVDVKPLISEIMPLSEAENALAIASSNGILKVLLSTA